MTPLQLLIDSCRRAHEYPTNLIDAGDVYSSILREYQAQLHRRADNLFCAEGHAALEFFRLEDGQSAFTSDPTRSLHDLRHLLPCSAGQIWKDRRCSFVFVGARTSRDVLQVSHDMMVWVLSISQVLPAFSEFILPFGRQLYAVDFQFSGFREINRLEAAFQSNAIPEIGRSGQYLQICYNLKTFEPQEGRAWSWSCRQAAVLHSFDLKHGQATWIIIKANNIIRDRLKEVSDARLAKDREIFSSVPKMFGNTLACHMVLVQWSGENWRWYINCFEEQLHNLKRRTVVEKVLNYSNANAAPVSASHTATASARNGRLAPRSGWTWRGPLSRTDNNNGSGTPSTALTQSQQQLPPILPLIEPEDPPNLPPEYESKNQFEAEQEQEHEYKIDELQSSQDLESRATEAILVLKSNHRILHHLESYYHQLADSPDLDQALKQSMKPCISIFVQRIRSVQNDLQIHLDRLETIAKLIAECKNLLYGIMEYQSMQANKMFAKEAQRSAGRMEEMTKRMQALTIKTTFETVLMRIITVVTVFFLPATFVSTLMSTDIVHYDPKISHLTAGNASLGAVKLFLVLSFSLMFATFTVGYCLYWWALRSTDREIET